MGVGVFIYLFILFFSVLLPLCCGAWWAAPGSAVAGGAAAMGPGLDGPGPPALGGFLSNGGAYGGQ